MRALVRFSVENPVLVNIVMVAILLGGAYSGLTLVREMFPETRPHIVMVNVPYPGATPQEIEKGLALRLEEAVTEVDDVEKITTDISEGRCTISVEMVSDLDDIDQAVTDIKAALDMIPRDELPEEAEEIRVNKIDPDLPVIAVALFGDVDESTRKALGDRLRDDMLRLPEVSRLVVGGMREAEITVEVAPEKLVEYQISLSEVASAIRLANLDLPGGQVKTTRQNVSIRTLGETDDAIRIADTVVRTSPTGEIVRVRDLAEVVDGFVDEESGGRFNGHPAVDATVYKTGDQDAIHIAETVKAFAAGIARQPFEWDWMTRLKNRFGMTTRDQRIYEQAFNDPYPANVSVEIHSNLARFIEGRLDLLKRNGIWGLSLVFLSLLIFLNARVAFWVMMGLLLSVAGALMLMQLLGATLNLLSMFGLIVVLGLIVDDAIVVGENVFARVERGEHPRLAAVRGAVEVSWPVIIAVATTIAAFLPLMFIEGRMGDFFSVLPVVVTCALAVSLIEAFSILPCHLADSLRPIRRDARQQQPTGWFAKLAAPLRQAEKRLLLDVFGGLYERLLRLAVRYRYVTVAAVLAAMLIAQGMVLGDRVPFVYLQKMDSETILADLSMPIGTPTDETRRALTVIEDAATDIEEIRTVFTYVGGQLQAGEGGTSITQRSHLAQAIIELKPVEERELSSDGVIAKLRQRTANIPGITSLRYGAIHGGPSGREIEIEVTGKRIEEILAASKVLKDKLGEYDGVVDIADDFEAGRPELQLELLDSARALGLTTRSLATEVRGAFYGLEARTLQRGREDLDVRVRFPEDRRRHIYELDQMRIAPPNGPTVPISEVARVSESRGAAGIRRVDQRQAVVVFADVDQAVTNAERVTANLQPTIDQLLRDRPGLEIEFSGNKREASKSLGSLRRDFLIAIVAIYFMLAGLFKSYLQPLVVLTAVPFGFNGAVAGHLIMGYPLTVLSMIGLVALTGIVVNDSLILVDFVNKEVAKGTPISEAVVAGGLRRMRAILLTSMTTILGLAPLMAETSFQARFLIPMAISISFGLAFATVLTLVVVPANYVILEDLKAIARRVWPGRHADVLEPAVAMQTDGGLAADGSPGGPPVRP